MRLPSKYESLIEILSWIIGLVFFIYILRSMLFLGQTTMGNESIAVRYSIFQYFAENIINGVYPLWNPFTHAGEPLWPLLINFRLLDIQPLVIYLAQFITDDLVIIFNWGYVTRNVIMLVGVYIVLRLFAIRLFIRLTLIPILLFSSLMFISFSAPAFASHFLTIPYIAYFLFRITCLKDHRWFNWLFLAGLIGLNWQGNLFGSMAVFLFFFLLGLLLFQKGLLKEVFREKMIVGKLLVVFMVVAIMMLPNIVAYRESTKKYIFATRLNEIQKRESTSLSMGYEYAIKSGTYTHPRDYLMSITPDASFVKSTPHKTVWGGRTESFLYIGLLPWSIAVLGMVAGRHHMKKTWLCVMLGIGVLMFGAPGLLHRLLYYFYPPLWFNRNIHNYFLCFSFAVLYFYVIGFNHIYLTRYVNAFSKQLSEKRSYVGIVLMTISVCLAMFWITRDGFSSQDYLALWPVGVLVVLGWGLYKYIGDKGLYISLLLGQVLWSVIRTVNPIFNYIIYVTVIVGIPLILFFVIKGYGIYFSSKARRYLTWSLFILFFVNLVYDLTYFTQGIKPVYSQKNPGVKCEFDTTVKELYLPQHRQLSSQCESDWREGQYLKYFGSAARQLNIFSVRGDPPLTFDEALVRPPEPTLFQLANYYNLVNLDVSSKILEEMFALNKKIFQFKTGAVFVEEREIPGLFGELGLENSLQLLENYIFIAKQLEGELIDSGVPVIDYDQVIQDSFDYSAKENEFFYQITHYETNSITMEVLTNQAGLLYWVDGFDGWWKADLNGNDVSIYRANVNFKAIFLPKGKNFIRFYYDPAFVKIAMGSFYGILLCTFFGGLMSLVMQRDCSKNLEEEIFSKQG